MVDGGGTVLNKLRLLGDVDIDTDAIDVEVKSIALLDCVSFFWRAEVLDADTRERLGDSGRDVWKGVGEVRSAEYLGELSEFSAEFVDEQKTQWSLEYSDAV